MYLPAKTDLKITKLRKNGWMLMAATGNAAGILSGFAITGTENRFCPPQKISLAFQANLISITAGHFSTGVSCDGETVKVANPITGQEYILTLHGCEQTRHSFAEIGAKGMVYPEYCQILSYSITPELDRSLFTIRDCAEGDQPRMGDVQGQSGGSDGPTAVFMAGKNAAPEKRSAVSSLHFEPVPEVQWRVIFKIKRKNDVETSFPIRA